MYLVRTVSLAACLLIAGVVCAENENSHSVPGHFPEDIVAIRNLEPGVLDSSQPVSVGNDVNDVGPFKTQMTNRSILAVRNRSLPGWALSVTWSTECVIIPRRSI